MAVSNEFSKKLLFYTLILMNLVFLGMEILYSALPEEKLNIIEIAREMFDRSWFTVFGIWVYEIFKTKGRKKLNEVEN